MSHDRQLFRGTLNHQALGELKLDPCGISAAGRQHVGDNFRHVAKLELDRRNIEREDYRHLFTRFGIYRLIERCAARCRNWLTER